MSVRERAKQEQSRVVSTRRAQLEEAEAELARREREVSRCRERQEAARRRMMEEAAGGTGAAQLVKHRTHLAELRQSEQELLAAVSRQKGVVTRCASELESALERLREASKELKVIEKHKERWQEEQRLEGARREQKINDELAAILHEKRSSE